MEKSSGQRNDKSHFRNAPSAIVFFFFKPHCSDANCISLGTGFMVVASKSNAGDNPSFFTRQTEVTFKVLPPFATPLAPFVAAKSQCSDVFVQLERNPNLE